MALPAAPGMASSVQAPSASPGAMGSAFFSPPAQACDGTLAMLHLKRDNIMPVRLQLHGGEVEGYGTESVVTNTRFGSFPHDTLVGLEWGSQVRASKVDTGSRGRTGKTANEKNGGVVSEVGVMGKAETEEKVSKKRGADEAGMDDEGGLAKKKKPRTDADAALPKSQGKHHQQQKKAAPRDDHTAKLSRGAKAPVEAGSGFIHLLQPTPETWTSSLAHRTQVVYTPDYSYILQRLRVKPGDTIIEAGAGSGSFTHAAARAVFSGYGAAATTGGSGDGYGEQGMRKRRKHGRVYSYEYHLPRVGVLRQELDDHGLDGVVTLTHRDICADGFSVPPTASSSSATSTASNEPAANAVFLDLPKPWEALKHLTRNSEPSTGTPSPLDTNTAVHLCSFSPCIEQVTATVAELRRRGWTEIGMVEVANRRIDVRREQVGLRNEGLRGVNVSAATVEEALGRLREVEGGMAPGAIGREQGTDGRVEKGVKAKGAGKAERLARLRKEAEERKLYKEGNLVHRMEPEVKTHTSYLVFAVLPRGWSDADERACAEKWNVDEGMRAEQLRGDERGGGGGGAEAVVG